MCLEIPRSLHELSHVAKWIGLRTHRNSRGRLKRMNYASMKVRRFGSEVYQIAMIDYLI